MDKEKLLCYLILLIGVIVGWSLKWIWDGVRARRRKPSSLKEIIEDAMKAWKRAFVELDGTPIDAEYKGGKVQIVENKPNSRL